MLLCPLHHHKATVEAMLEPEQRSHKSSPFNITKGTVKGMLTVNQETPVINLGTCQLVGEGDFILIDGESLLSMRISEGRLQLSMKLYDESDSLVAEVRDNEWISGDPLPWDLESMFQWLRIRRKLRDIRLEIDARKWPLDITADIWRKHDQFHLSSDGILYSRNGIQFTSMAGLTFVGARIEADTAKRGITIGPDPRFGQFIIGSEPADVKERVRQGLEAWKQLACEHVFVTIVKRSRYSFEECGKCKKTNKVWT